jgi:cellulose synthase/poly-beta-1,6-N-acetylglucosamine synthase-like glycosyltransferase
VLPLFWIAVLFVFYTYLLYPAIIIPAGMIRRRRKPRDPGEGELPSVSMIIAAYNEEGAMESKLADCDAIDYPRHLLEIIIVSDGSTDRTDEILRRSAGIRFIEADGHFGKPHQLNRALKEARGEILVFSDARQLYRPDALRMLVRNFEDPRIGCVSGELVLRDPGGRTAEQIGLYWRYEKLLRNAESRVDSTLGVTGAIYAMRRALAAPIPDDTILDDVEIPLQAFRKGYRVIFEPEAVAYDTPAAEIGTEFRRKVRTLAGNFQLFARNRWLLVPWRNRIWLQTVSHKLFRLLVPYAMAAALVATALLEGAAWRALLLSQLLCYGYGLAAMRSAALRRGRIASFLAVFLSLNAAAVVALVRWLTGGADVRWRKG